VKGRGHLGNVSVDERIILKLVFKETGVKCVDWIIPAQDRILSGSCQHCKGPFGSVNGVEYLDQLSFSRTLLHGVHFYGMVF
jgi:hypothetical protein